MCGDFGWVDIKLIFGKTTMLIPQVHSMCTVGPSSLKWAQLVP